MRRTLAEAADGTRILHHKTFYLMKYEFSRLDCTRKPFFSVAAQRRKSRNKLGPPSRPSKRFIGGSKRFHWLGFYPKTCNKSQKNFAQAFWGGLVRFGVPFPLAVAAALKVASPRSVKIATF